LAEAYCIDLTRLNLFFAGFLFFYEVTPDKAEKKTANPNDQQILPAPLNLFLDSVDPDDHYGKGQEHEPDGNQKRSSYFLKTNQLSHPSKSLLHIGSLSCPDLS
jgi:hypothetical protein